MTLNEALDMARIDPVATKALREKLIKLEVFKFRFKSMLTKITKPVGKK